MTSAFYYVSFLQAMALKYWLNIDKDWLRSKYWKESVKYWLKYWF